MRRGVYWGNGGLGTFSGSSFPCPAMGRMLNLQPYALLQFLTQQRVSVWWVNRILFVWDTDGPGLQGLWLEQALSSEAGVCSDCLWHSQEAGVIGVEKEWGAVSTTVEVSVVGGLVDQQKLWVCTSAEMARHWNVLNGGTVLPGLCFRKISDSIWG